MKVLFICKGNIGRSQMARAFYDKLSGYKSESAGVNVSEETKKLKLGQFIPAKDLISCMQEEGLDLRDREIKQVSPEMIKSANIIIALTPKEDLPDFVVNSNKVHYWNIENPKDMNLEDMRKIRNQIKGLIEEFINNSQEP